MEFRNDRGRAIDPVPFFVVTGLAFLLSYSYLPITFLEMGLSLNASLSVATLGFLGGTALAYYWLVWTARPELRGEIPLANRLRRMLYGALAAAGAMAFLALLAVAR